MKVPWNKWSRVIQIRFGYRCGDMYCDCASKCKYKTGTRLHNLSVTVRRFFEYRLRIKLPKFFIFYKEWSRLSGTIKCPFRKQRIYTCADCKFQAGYDEYYNGLCGNTEYIRLNKEGRSSEHYVDGRSYCKFFEKNDRADKYNIKTGKTIWDI